MRIVKRARFGTMMLLLGVAGLVWAGTPESPAALTVTPDLKAIPSGQGWKGATDKITLVEKEGSPAVEGRGDAVVWLDHFEFTDGSIEFDGKGKSGPPQSNFMGIVFRVVDEKTHDVVYFRPFNFRADSAEKRSHAVQYASHPDWPWPRLRQEKTGQYEKAIEPAPDGDAWFHAKMVVEKPKVSVFVNNASDPSLVVNELTERRGGSIGLYFYASGTIANLKITPTSDQPTASASPPVQWKFVADDWNFGRLTFGPHTDGKGRTLDALRFSVDEAAVMSQFRTVQNAEAEAMAGRIYDGSHAVFTTRSFRDGTIEADVCGTGALDFQGIIFRASEAALTSRRFDGEIIYFRPFYANSDNPHYPAIQYFATQRDGVHRRMFASLQSDPKIPRDTWFHVHIEVRGAVARVFLNDAEEPALVVPKLESGRNEGLVGFWGWNGRLANLKITPASK